MKKNMIGKKPTPRRARSTPSIWPRKTLLSVPDSDCRTLLDNIGAEEGREDAPQRPAIGCGGERCGRAARGRCCCHCRKGVGARPILGATAQASSKREKPLPLVTSTRRKGSKISFTVAFALRVGLCSQWTRLEGSPPWPCASKRLVLLDASARPSSPAAAAARPTARAPTCRRPSRWPHPRPALRAARSR